MPVSRTQLSQVHTGDSAQNIIRMLLPLVSQKQDCSRLTYNGGRLREYRQFIIIGLCLEKPSMAQVSSTMTITGFTIRSLVPQKLENGVRTIGIAECSEAGRSLAHSFAADALSRYLLDGDDMAGYSDERKWKLHVDIMTYIVASHCYKGLVTAAGPDYDGIALWYVFRKLVRDLKSLLTAISQDASWPERG